MRRRLWGRSSGQSLRNPADDGAIIAEPYQRGLKLDQYLKWRGLVATGGEAKLRIQRGDVRVNGVIETRRGHRLNPGDVVHLDGLDLNVDPSTGASCAGEE
jgi:ribosome-associated protein